MTAVDDIRAMVDRIVAFVAERGNQWERSGSPDRLLLEAASLMSGVSDALDGVGVTLERTKETP